MKKKCLYSLECCSQPRYLNHPLCYEHYYYLINLINSDQYIKQSGGNILSAVSKISQLASKHSGQLTSTVDKISTLTEQGIMKAEQLNQQATQLSNRIENITGQISSLTGSFDSQFSQNQLVANTPLGTQGNFQSFGDFVCIKKSFLSDLRVLLFELLANRIEIE